MSTIEITGIDGIPEVQQGDDLVGLILDALERSGDSFAAQDILVVTHKVISKQEGRVVEIPTEQAYRSLVESEAVRIVRRRGDLVIAQTRHGFICANAAVDRSNVEAGYALLLPVDPDRSAHRIRTLIAQRTGITVAVIVTDTFGRPWRRGLVDIAIGVSGMSPILDLIGTVDTHGNELHVTQIAVVDEIAAAADLVMGKSAAIPAAIIRGLVPEGEGRGIDLVRPASEDLFR